MTDEQMFLEYDLIVIGAGMAGLSAAGRAADAGAKVLVVEKASEIGGSGQHAGFLWTVPDERVLRGWDDGDPHLARVVLENFPEGTEWMRSRGMFQSGPTPVLHGLGYALNVTGHLQDCTKMIRKAGGQIILGAFVEELILSPEGRVEGARILDDNELIEVKAEWTLIATGGFQANPALRAEKIHPNAAGIALRSNPNSTGDGIRLGLQAGSTWAGENPGFYGHLISSPACLNNPSLFTRLSQYHSDYSLLFNEEGVRFTDESQGDFRSSNELVFQPNARGLLVWDEHIQQEHVLKSFVHGVEAEDRLQVALQHGALGIKVKEITELSDIAAQWGFDGKTVVQSIKEYNEKVVSSPEKINPSRAYDLRPLDKAPYYALVVEPAITFTHAGLRIDDQARALNSEGKPIPGLLVAGADTGNVYKRGYGGGLAMALGFALQAVKTAGWIVPKVSNV
ncbi:FAD-dependent oxidoreductase [Peribacillus sp. NPDC097225]|uniref:FAD-dependent oxidoreductase n=1 Tax=Peribacillus sp. NPDC097225 TaxID=3364400 RepID=UPI00382DD2F1